MFEEGLYRMLFLLFNPIASALVLFNAAVLSAVFRKTPFGRLTLVISLLFGLCLAFAAVDYLYCYRCRGSALSPVNQRFFELLKAPLLLDGRKEYNIRLNIQKQELEDNG